MAHTQSNTATDHFAKHEMVIRTIVKPTYSYDSRPVVFFIPAGFFSTKHWYPGSAFSLDRRRPVRKKSPSSFEFIHPLSGDFAV